MEFTIELEGFTGPFDLLLKLIEKQKIDIYDINLEDVTNDYLSEIEKLDPAIEDLSSFIYIASVLLNIKSNKLLPREKEENLEEDFIAYLIEYKKIKSVQDDLKLLEAEARKIHSKYGEDLAKFEAEEEIITKDVKILANQFQKLLKRIEKEEKPQNIISQIKIPDVNDYLSSYRKALDIRNDLKLDLIINEIHTKAECIASFLALLELCKLREIYLEQNQGNKFHIKKRM
ncbi:segregation and condensation protein A [Anaerococcus sp. DFU013_CI05]|uniref:segregation and condensation protein A n=1 Tax=unclassified Anaerococcus TaxID=2614126 RepID=UPI0019332BD7|nr:segregation/condensation protein A [Anaerococcus sp. mt242]MBM0046371.1 segregation/condensation protein A [Anaerococcus sp. mt242]